METFSALEWWDDILGDWAEFGQYDSKEEAIRNIPPTWESETDPTRFRIVTTTIEESIR